MSRSFLPIALLALGSAMALSAAGYPYSGAGQGASQDAGEAQGHAGAAGVAGAPENDEEITLLLQGLLEESIIPGAVAAIASVDGSLRVGATGVRRAKSDVAIEASDLMHIGSCTKAMTATLIARLVDRGKLEWSMTIASGLPELAKRIHRDYASVTMLDLLRHASGMPANAPNWFGFSKLSIHERRVEIAARALTDAPATKPGTKFLYSNLGVMVAGLMAETAMDASWEELMAAEVFGPLGMATAGFGVPGAKGEISQPWGHKVMARKALLPMQGDNAAALGPAGTVHLSLSDWAKFALEFTDHAAAASSFLKPASREKLVEVGLDDYACGWITAHRPWARKRGDPTSKGRVLTHSGSNTTWFATVWIAPETGYAYLVAVNAAGDPVGKDVDLIISALIDLVRDKVPASAAK